LTQIKLFAKEIAARVLLQPQEADRSAARVVMDEGWGEREKTRDETIA
jgi:hypothetical protein